jgi:O-6-methylguanine DNA methyltransferase
VITDFQAEVYEFTTQVPKGRVTTYKAIAQAIAKKRGKPMSNRAVGQALNKNPFSDVPAHRVVLSSGDVGGWNSAPTRTEKGIFTEKVRRLEKEGIKVENNKIKNFDKILFCF